MYFRTGKICLFGLSFSPSWWMLHGANMHRNLHIDVMIILKLSLKGQALKCEKYGITSWLFVTMVMNVWVL
jgi:hypothetical protein